MRIGLNLLSSFIADPKLPGPEVARLVDMLHETNCVEFRINIIWRRFEEWAREGFKVNQKTVDHFSLLCEILPKRSNVLAVVLMPPGNLAVEYFHDQSAIGQKYHDFMTRICGLFPQITDFEIWNEPNASDFYLSVGTPTGHRPWTPHEFMRDIFIPGATAVRANRPDARICLAGVAEDGMVGHEEKEPALANTLPDDAVFLPMRSKKPFGRFYFIPGFLEGLIQEIVPHMTSGPNEIPRFTDAIAFHPYPYFRIDRDKKKGEKPLVLSERTIHHSDTFLRIAKPVLDNGVECWVTEFGARTLDVANAHRHDEGKQREYLIAACDHFAKAANVSRAYWYKFEDLDWEMTQEKTFGMIDNNGSRKSSFNAFVDFYSDANRKIHSLGENFEEAYRSGAGGFRENWWKEESNTTFSYCAVGMSSRGIPVASISPGKNKGDWRQVTSRKGVFLSEDDTLDLALGYIPPASGGAQIALHVALLDRLDSPLLAFSIANGSDGYLITVQDTGEKHLLRELGALEKVGARVGKNQKCIELAFDDGAWSHEMKNETFPEENEVRVRLRFESILPFVKQSKQCYCQVHSVRLRAGKESNGVCARSQPAVR